MHIEIDYTTADNPTHVYTSVVEIAAADYKFIETLKPDDAYIALRDIVNNDYDIDIVEILDAKII